MSEAGKGDDGWIPAQIHLESSLDAYQQEHEAWYQAPADPEKALVAEALSVVAEHALNLLRTGRVPATLAERLQTYQPWLPLEERVTGLLKYTYVHRRMEFAVAWEVVSRLSGVEDRLLVSFVAMLELRQSTPSETAAKFLHEVSELYLAGFEAPVFVLAGAVLEAAMRARIPDEDLLAAGVRPRYGKTGVYSIGQRMDHEKKAGILNDAERRRFWKVVNWRNDVLHVQPDIVSHPGVAVLEVASLLGRILPRHEET